MLFPKFSPEGFHSPEEARLNRLAAKDLAMKLRFEVSFRKDLRNFMNKLNDDFYKGYKDAGVVIAANQYRPALQKLLFEHMLKIGKSFSSKLRMQAAKSTTMFREYKAVDLEVDRQVEAYAAFAASNQSALITTTNQDEMVRAVAKVQRQAINKQEMYTRQEAAKMASNYFKGWALNRVDLIAATETQNMAEKSKMIEASFISNTVYTKDYSWGERENPRGLKLFKRWVTVLDERTRLAHVVADGQKRDMEDPYEVGGDKLMFPGDYSLGAAPGNTINCRCSSISEFDPLGDVYDHDENDLPGPERVYTREFEDIDGNRWGFVRGLANTPRMDSHGDIVPIGVWEKELARLNFEGITHIKMLPIHLKTGNYHLGWFPVKQMRVTKDGLYVEGYIDLSDNAGKDAFEKVVSRYYTDFSVGTDNRLSSVETVDFEYIGMDGQTLPSDTSNAIHHKRFTKYNLFEISLVPSGSAPGAVLWPIE